MVYIRRLSPSLVDMKPIPPRALHIVATFVALIGCSATMRAADYSFMPERFTTIDFTTTQGKSAIKVEEYDKTTDTQKTIFESKLAAASEEPNETYKYVTPGGTTFTLHHLPKAIVNDKNRGIQSGDWKLTFSGKGAEFERLKETMPVSAMGNERRHTYLGTKSE